MSEAINLALIDSLKINKKLFCFGLGINDPKRIFGTTTELVERFGHKRVFDTPTAENGMTGYSIGAALKGCPSVATHQRVDFFLLAMDQLVNSAAKWHYMFGDKTPIPITIRLIVGKGWGQGPTHSQHLHSWFCHIPGLKVVCPTNPNDAYHLLKQSIKDPNPVIFLEHRWLHNSLSKINFKSNEKMIGKSKVVSKGSNLTLVSSSNLVIECLKVKEIFKLNKIKFDIEIIDIRSYKPFDLKTIAQSLKKTKYLMVVDPGFQSCSFASEIISEISTQYFDLLKSPPIKLTNYDIPEPTSHFYTSNFYLDYKKIIKEIKKIFFKRKKLSLKIPNYGHHDIPGDWFNGPF